MAYQMHGPNDDLSACSESLKKKRPFLPPHSRWRPGACLCLCTISYQGQARELGRCPGAATVPPVRPESCLARGLGCWGWWWVVVVVGDPG